jgi:hypothetical protein
MLQHRFKLLNEFELKWAFCSCNMANVQYNEHLTDQWQVVDGFELLRVGGPQSAAAVVSRVALMEVGLFPQFGKYGAGDWALGKKLARANYNCCYLRQPLVVHLGDGNIHDFPEFQKAQERDINENYFKAIKWK